MPRNPKYRVFERKADSALFRLANRSYSALLIAPFIAVVAVAGAVIGVVIAD